MSTLQDLSIPANQIRSSIRLVLAFSPLLLIASASAENASLNDIVGCNQFAYVANEDANNVSGYKINAANGELTALEGSPFTTGESGPTSVAVDPAGRFLYVTNQYLQDNDVAGFRIDCASGKLTPVPGSPFAAASGPSAIAIDPSGRFAYVSNLGSNSVSAYTIDGSSGRLVPVSGSPFAAGTFPASVAVDPLGKFVYVTNELSNSVSGYTINAKTGALTAIAGSPFATGTFPLSVAVDPNDRFAYVADEGSGEISGYSINPTTGALTALATSPYAGGTGQFESITVDPTGGFVYLADEGGVFAYSINQNSTAIGGTGIPPMDLYGQLTPVTGSPFGGGTPAFAAVDYTGTFVYAANKSSNDVSAYTLSSGALKPIGTSSFPTGAGPVSIALVRPRTVPLYTATEIPDPADFGSAEVITAAAINNKGEVTGTVRYYPQANDNFVQAFIYAGGTTTGIAFSRVSSGNDINDSGQVVGQTDLQPPSPLQPPAQAFLYNYSSKSTVDIDTVAGRQSVAFGINDAGHITGSLSTGTCLPAGSCNLGATHAFTYSGSSLVDIGTLGGTFSQGTSINNLDEIAGISTVAGGSLSHLFLYAQGHMRDLGTLAGESFVNAAINDREEIIGSALNSTGVPTSFLHRENGFEKLPFIAGGINNSGDIVGAEVVANGSSHALLRYCDGKLIDLNDLVGPSVPLLTSAAGISDNGKIVATGLNGHLYVLTRK
jgi:6-phosphogluconolactonase